MTTNTSQLTLSAIPGAWPHRGNVEALFAAALLPVFVCCLGPWWSEYQFHVDEGFNLIKGGLLADGHALYEEIWSDQPPGLTLILAALHWAFPYSVGAARAAILAFSSLLIWSLFRVVCRTDGTAAAWAAVAALVTSSVFLTLSVSVMIGLPAIALALCAIDQAMVGATEQRPIRFLLAGLLFGLSLQIKMWTMLMLPSLICAIVLGPEIQGLTNAVRARQVAWTLAAAVATFFVIAFATHEPLLAPLVTPHLEPSKAARASFDNFNWIFFLKLLSQEIILLGLGVAGVVLILSRPKTLLGTPVIPILWVFLSIATFVYWRPVFPHHLPMTLVPLAWLSGSTVGRGLAWLHRTDLGASYGKFFTFALFATFVVAAVWLAPRFGKLGIPRNPIALTMRELPNDPSVKSWVITDNGMDAYRAGVLVPPELAVYSVKRLTFGNLPATLIISAIRDHQPSQVMFRRFPIHPDVRSFLDNSPSYVRNVWSAQPHYIRSDLARGKFGANAPPSGPRAAPPTIWPSIPAIR